MAECLRLPCDCACHGDQDWWSDPPYLKGQKGRKLPEISWLDPAAMKALAEVSGTGARKYSPYNYRAGYDWSLSYNALFRHMNAFWDGEDYDPDDGQHHMASAAWHALQLLSASLRGVGNDDRYKGVE